MKVVVTGSHGLIGSALVRALEEGGDEVTRLVRRDSTEGPRWDPETGEIAAEALEGHDAAVHLAGETIAGRWTAEKKRRIRDSRVNGARALCRALASLATKPRVLVVASGMGYYGSGGDAELTEESPRGEGFLATVATDTEAQARLAADAGIRVVILRFGMVLSPKGGALASMLPAFRLGLGGTLGNGKQFWSWLAIDDAVGAIRHVIGSERLAGVVNAASPNPVRQRGFARTLARVLRRPAFFRLPGFVLRLTMGELADELLLSSIRLRPKRLLESGYPFRFPDLEPALRHLLARED